MESHTQRVIGESSMEAMVAEIKAFHQKHGDQQPPPGWISVKEYVEATGLTNDSARHLLDSCVQRREAQRKSFRVRGTDGVTRATSYFLLKPV